MEYHEELVKVDTLMEYHEELVDVVTSRGFVGSLYTHGVP